MPRIPFEALPDDARLWVFPTSAPLTPYDTARLTDTVDGFLADWKAHGHPLTVARTWVDGRFLLVGVDQRSEPPSGCSIDAFLRVLKQAEQVLGIRLTDHGPVWYRDAAGDIRAVPRSEFGALAAAGTVAPETRVFDTTITRVDQLRGGRFEVPASDAWHGRAFFRDALTS